MYHATHVSCDPRDFKYYLGKINNKTVNFVFAFIAFNNAFNNEKDNLTLLHMEEIFIS